MISLMILGGMLLGENHTGLLIEFIIITIVSLIFLYIISEKTFTYLTRKSRPLFRAGQ